MRDRTTVLRRVRAGDLLPDPRNWRRHPPAQRDALQAVLDDVGFADVLKVREDDGRMFIVDGHLRADIDPEAMVPVVVLDISADEAGRIIATFDPISAMASRDQEALDALLETLTTDDATLRALWDSLRGNSDDVRVAELVDGEPERLVRLTFQLPEADVAVVEQALAAMPVAGESAGHRESLQLLELCRRALGG